MKMASERDMYIAGLRELANFLDRHPDLPVPCAGAHNAFARSTTELAVCARTPGVHWTKGASGLYFYLSVEFSGMHSYKLNLMRELVCRKVVTGTRMQPAVPAREIEEYEWVCNDQLLAAIGTKGPVAERPATEVV